MIDINQPVTNPELVNAIEALIKEETTDTERVLIEQLKSAHFLMVFDGELKHGAPDTEGRITLEKSTTLQFPMLSDREGRPMHIAFTDWDALRIWCSEPNPKTLVVPFSDLPGMVLREDSRCAGIIVNPASHNLLLSRERLAYISGRANPYTVDKPTQVMLGEPADYPYELIKAVSAVMKRIRAVKKAWFLLMTKEGEQGYLIVVDFQGDKAKVFDAVGQAVMPHLKSGQFVDIVLASDSFGQTAVKNRKPFYKRSLFV